MSPRISPLLPVAVFLVLSSGCDRSTPTVVDSPAGEGSAEAFVSSAGDGVWMSWLEKGTSDEYGLWVARWSDEGWSERRLVSSRSDFFVNWADFPSVVVDRTGRLWAHWLQRGGEGGYDYGVRVVWSDDQGATWSEPWTPHEDGTPQEHGFVSIQPFGDGVALSWLDGRRYAGWPEGTEPTREMTVRFRTRTVESAGPEVLLDERGCDCCQTDMAITEEGPVVVYRDRSEAEIRDIAIVRLVDEVWTEPAPVHVDGWEIGGCPVNGPAVVAEGREVAVAWFTGAHDEPRVKVAFSSDAGATFGPPVIVDGGNPSGRVDLLRMPDGAVVVSWLERLGGEQAEVRVRRVTPSGAMGPQRTVAASAAARGSGFPRMTHTPDGRVLVAWTDMDEGGSRVRVALMEEFSQ